jgi:hypothetical protein
MKVANVSMMIIRGDGQVEIQEPKEMPGEILRALREAIPAPDPEERLSEERFQELIDSRSKMKEKFDALKDAGTFPYDDSLVIHMVDQVFKTVHIGNEGNNEKLDAALEDVIVDYLRIFGDLTDEQIPDFGTYMSWYMSEEHLRMCREDDLRTVKVLQHSTDAAKAMHLVELLMSIKDHITEMDCDTCEKKTTCVLLKGWNRSQQKPI